MHHRGHLKKVKALKKSMLKTLKTDPAKFKKNWGNSHFTFDGKAVPPTKAGIKTYVKGVKKSLL
jgi:hypothetical protein